MTAAKHRRGPRPGSTSRVAALVMLGVLAAGAAGVATLPPDQRDDRSSPSAREEVDERAADAPSPSTVEDAVVPARLSARASFADLVWQPDVRDDDRNLLDQRASALDGVVQTFLDARAAAVLGDDVDAIGAGLAGGPGIQREQQVAANLVALPFAEFSYDVVDVTRVSVGTYEVRTQLDQQLDGVEAGASRTSRLLTMQRDAAGWRVATDLPDTEAGARPQTWEQGTLRVSRTPHALVIGLDGTDPSSYAGSAERAAVDVTSAWGTDWTQQVVVVVPRTTERLAQLLGYDDPAALEQVAAVTTTEPTPRGSEVEVRRVYVNPESWASLGALGRRAILTHEAVHVATGAPGTAQVPLWLEEGLADTIGFGVVDVTVEQAAQEALDAARADGVPQQLPTDAQFDFTGTDVGAAYGYAWIACRWVATTYGQDQLVELYRAVADGTLDSSRNVETAVRDVLGIEMSAFVREWREAVAAEAGVSS